MAHIAKQYVDPSINKYSTLIANPLPKQEPIEDCQLYCPYETEQASLAEYASCLVSRTYLKMCKIPFNVEFRRNAEFMSPHGSFTNVPLFKVDSFLGSDFKQMVKVLEEREVILSDHLSHDQRDDMYTYLSLVHDVFTCAELYMTFANDEVYETVTKPRISAAYPYLLGRIQSFRKRRQVLKVLEVNSYKSLSRSQVLAKVDQCCNILQGKLNDKPYIYGTKPTELDAALFGHLFAIISMDLPDAGLKQIVQKYSGLSELCYRIEKEYF